MKVQLLDETHICHPACAGATRDECTCICGGRFHGAHWVTFRAQVAADLDEQGGVMAVLGRRGGLAPADEPVAVRTQADLSHLSTDDFLDLMFND